MEIGGGGGGGGVNEPTKGFLEENPLEGKGTSDIK